ncbi:MAG: cytochrome c oxidase subunit II [Polymorphum sp.]|nr:cytochrome c oxidase subunit II [Polymorphum sp.]
MVPALAACEGPLSTLSPQGPAAADIASLWWAMLAGAALITCLVLALVWRAFVRAPGKAPTEVLGEAFWIKGMGLGFSFTVLFAVVGAGIWTGERHLPRPGTEAMRVEATARQWAWRFRQPGPDGTMVETEGRLHIPAGQPVDVVIRSQDVIHSFWVPQLAGKMDALPGRDTLLRIETFRPGLYQGRSAEFSGTGYAGMVFEVLAYDPASPPDFTSTDGRGAE